MKLASKTVQVRLVLTLSSGEDVKLFKANKCIKKMDKTMKAMKEFKLGKKGVGGCLNAFKACKTAQKAAPGYFTHLSQNSLVCFVSSLMAPETPIKLSQISTCLRLVQDCMNMEESHDTEVQVST